MHSCTLSVINIIAGFVYIIYILHICVHVHTCVCVCVSSCLSAFHACIFPQAAGKVCNCAFYRGPNSSDTQEIQLYSILGMLAGCGRVAVNTSHVSVPSGCGCVEEQFIEVGGSPVLVEGGVCSSGENVTVAIVNTCDCKLSLDLRCVYMYISLCVCVCFYTYSHVCTYVCVTVCVLCTCACIFLGCV